MEASASQGPSAGEKASSSAVSASYRAMLGKGGSDTFPDSHGPLPARAGPLSGTYIHQEHPDSEMSHITVLAGMTADRAIGAGEPWKVPRARPRLPFLIPVGTALGTEEEMGRSEWAGCVGVRDPAAASGGCRASPRGRRPLRCLLRFSS